MRGLTGAEAAQEMLRYAGIGVAMLLLHYIWVVRSDQIVASDPGEKAAYFDPMADKVYRHPTFYELPKSLDHM